MKLAPCGERRVRDENPFFEWEGIAAPKIDLRMERASTTPKTGHCPWPNKSNTAQQDATRQDVPRHEMSAAARKKISEAMKISHAEKKAAAASKSKSR